MVGDWAGKDQGQQSGQYGQVNDCERQVGQYVGRKVQVEHVEGGQDGEAGDRDPKLLQHACVGQRVRVQGVEGWEDDREEVRQNWNRQEERHLGHLRLHQDEERDERKSNS